MTNKAPNLAALLLGTLVAAPALAQEAPPTGPTPAPTPAVAPDTAVPEITPASTASTVAPAATVTETTPPAGPAIAGIHISALLDSYWSFNPARGATNSGPSELHAFDAFTNDLSFSYAEVALEKLADPVGFR